MKFFSIIFSAAVFLLLGAFPLQAQEMVKVGDRKIDTPSLPIAVDDYDDTWIKSDTHNSGKIDYAIKYDEKGKILYEAFSHFQNGFMDNFRFYEDGVPVREEIDTTGSHRIDLWVYLYQGVYISRWERSTNHDGIIDKIKVFGKNVAQK